MRKIPLMMTWVGGVVALLATAYLFYIVNYYQGAVERSKHSVLDPSGGSNHHFPASHE